MSYSLILGIQSYSSSFDFFSHSTNSCFMQHFFFLKEIRACYNDDVMLPVFAFKMHPSLEQNHHRHIHQGRPLLSPVHLHHSIFLVITPSLWVEHFLKASSFLDVLSGLLMALLLSFVLFCCYGFFGRAAGLVVNHLKWLVYCLCVGYQWGNP